MRVPDYSMAESEKWSNVDAYFSGLLAPSDTGLDVGAGPSALTIAVRDCRKETRSD